MKKVLSLVVMALGLVGSSYAVTGIVAGQITGAPPVPALHHPLNQNKVLIRKAVSVPDTPGAHSVSLTCNEVDTGVSFNLYRGTVSGQEALYVSQLPACAYVDASVTQGTTYYYEMTAQDSLGDQSPLSNEASALVPNDPSAPSGLSATVK